VYRPCGPSRSGAALIDRAPLEPAPLIPYAIAVLALQVVTSIVGFAADWPAQFDGQKDPNLLSGSAISAPLVPLLVLAAAIVLARRSGRCGVVGVVLICILGIMFVIGSPW
jgi:hypothetical protein